MTIFDTKIKWKICLGEIVKKKSIKKSIQNKINSNSKNKHQIWKQISKIKWPGMK
jgi:hypothetical protein